MLRYSLPLLLVAGTLYVFVPGPVIGAGDSTDQAATSRRAAPSDQSGATNPFAGKQEAAAAGKQIFLQTGCYNCHGVEAKGGGIAPDLTASKLDSPQMFKTIHDGRRGTLMPSWGSQLDSEEIWKVVTYLRSLRPDG